MAIRDVVVLNTTSSRLEVQQSSDSIRISGTSTQLLSIENSSGTSVFELNAPSSSISFTGNITASGNFSSSIQTVSSSFGRIQATKLVGTAGNLTNTEIGTGIVSGSTQLESEISGAFASGFEFTGTIGKAVGVFSAGGAMNAVNKNNGSAGIRNAALSFGGSPNAFSTEEYNGSVWSTSNNLSTAMTWTAGAGYLTSALAFGGNSDQDETQKYDGTSWSETGNLILGRYMIYGAGTQNAAIAATGFTPACSPAPFVRCTELFDGSTWSETSDVITGTARGSATGTQNATVIAGGEPTLTCTEEWDGGSWATGGALITGRAGTMGIGVGGTVNTTVAIGGAVGTKQCVEEYNGTSWSVGGLLINGRSDGGAAGTQDSAVAFGGCDYPAGNTVACTEHYDGFLPVSSSFGKLIATTISADASKLENTGLAGTVSSSTQIASDVSGSFRGGFEFTGTIGTRQGVWSSGTALPAATRGIVGVGSKNTAMFFGGNGGGSNFSTNHHYNGTNWSAGGALIIATNDSATAGTEYAALSAGGQSSAIANTFEYYGETWAAGGSLIAEKSNAAGFGLQNAALVVGGRDGDSTRTMATTEQYNGSTWSEVGDLNTGVDGVAGAGTVNAAIVFGGQISPSLAISNCTELYNGSSWSATTGMITSRLNHGGSGLQNSAVAFGGQPGPVFGATTEEWNGTAWSTTGALSTARYSSKNFTAHAHSAIMAGGRNPGVVSCTETYTGFYASASFGRLDATTLVGSGIGLSNKIAVGTLSGSAQIAGDITGSFIRGVYGMTGEVSTATGVWSTGVSLNTPRNGGHGAGTTGAGLVSGGQTPSTVANTEEWNGTTWSESGDLITARKNLPGSTGHQNAALMGGAEPGPTCTEEYNGASWASGGALSSNRKVATGFGTQNAAVQTGNYQCTADWTALYDGTAWSRGARPTFHNGTNTDHFAGAGTQNAGLAFAGRVAKTNTEHFDGTSWAKGGSLSTGKSYANGTGTENAALTFGGNALSPSNNALSEEYDGSVWSSGGTMLESGANMNTFGTLESTLASSRTQATQEYSSYHLDTGGTYIDYISATSASIQSVSGYHPLFYESGSDAFCGSVYGTMLSGSDALRPKLKRNKQDDKLEVKKSFQMPVFYTDPVTGSAGELWYNAVDNALKFTFDYNTWSAGGALICARRDASHAGSQNAALTAGGLSATANQVTCTEEYNGSSWSAGGDLPSISSCGVGHGTQNAALARVGGGASTEYYKYDGSAWSQVADFNTGRCGMGGAGSQNAALIFGGSANCTNTEAFNGTSWVVGGSLITGRGKAGSGGTVNAAIFFGGTSPGVNHTDTEEYNGSTWAAGGALNTGQSGWGGSGNQYAMVGFRGTIAEEYNGTTWSNTAILITNRAAFGSHSSGNQSDALATGGSPACSCTEEYSATYVKTVCLNS